MPRDSPQTTRLVHVLEVLTASGRAGRTLAELARSLGVDKATCRPMLMELTSAGYLIRDPRKMTFHLGPRLVVIGRAAEHAVDVVDIARHALASLADATGISAAAITASADELIVADLVPPAHATARARRALRLRPGDRIPFRPPLGAVLAAWGRPADLQRWRDRALPTDDQLDDVLAAVRERGFAVEQFRPAPDDLATLIERSAGDFLGARRSAALLEDHLERLAASTMMVAGIDPDAEIWPVSINAPVLDDAGIVTMAVCLLDPVGPMTGRQVEDLGGEVRAAARSIGDHLTATRPGPAAR